MRVLLGPGDTANFATRLARALADRGAVCKVVDLARHPYSAPIEKLGKASLWGHGLTRVVTRLIQGGSIMQTLGKLLKMVGQYYAFLWALARADALVMISSRSLLPGYLDLPFYRLFGKRVIRVFLGTDSRPRYMTGWHDEVMNPATQRLACQKLAKRVERQRARVRFMSRHADIVVDNPLCGHYQQRAYINWFHVGFPHDPAFFYNCTPSKTAVEGGHVRILHSPSNPAVKGTDQIDAVINKLKTEGVAFEYTRITGMPRTEVMEHLRHCDLVIDQLYSDSPMAGLASEAAAWGKPIIVGGYGWSHLHKHMGEGFAPNILCKPEALEQVVREAIRLPDQARAIGEQANAFMNEYWHQDAVADRFATLLTGQGIRDDWWVDPSSIDYWQGLGATDEHRMAVIKSLVAERSMDALGLDPRQAVYQTIASWPGGA